MFFRDGTIDPNVVDDGARVRAAAAAAAARRAGAIGAKDARDIDIVRVGARAKWRTPRARNPTNQISIHYHIESCRKQRAVVHES
jgi:hypothetical protein